MRHYLLFDSSCVKCASLADEVERASGGWLEPRSLRDPAIQTLLNEVTPSWRWRPMLLEVKHDHIRVYAGITMGSYLVKNLGIRRCLQLARLVLHASQPVRISDSGRRRFLHYSFYSIVSLALLPKWLTPRFSSTERKDQGGDTEIDQVQHPTMLLGEPYEGFLLLADMDAPVPSYTQHPTSIVLHGDPEVPSTGNIVAFADLQELAAYIPFTLYAPSNLPGGVEFIGSEVVEFAKTRDIYEVRILYGPHNGNQNTNDISIVLSAKYDYPQPFPIWPSRGQAPQADSQSQVLPEKVTFTPQPGILLPNAIGHQIHWLQETDKVAYTLLVEHDPSRGAAEQLVRSLVTV